MYYLVVKNSMGIISVVPVMTCELVSDRHNLTLAYTLKHGATSVPDDDEQVTNVEFMKACSCPTVS